MESMPHPRRAGRRRRHAPVRLWLRRPRRHLSSWRRRGSNHCLPGFWGRCSRSGFLRPQRPQLLPRLRQLQDSCSQALQGLACRAGRRQSMQPICSEALHDQFTGAVLPRCALAAANMAFRSDMTRCLCCTHLCCATQWGKHSACRRCLQVSAYASSQLKMMIPRLPSGSLCLVTGFENACRAKAPTLRLWPLGPLRSDCACHNVLEPDTRCLSMLCVAVYHFASRAP